MPRFCADGIAGIRQHATEGFVASDDPRELVEVAARLLNVRFLQRDVEQRARVANAGRTARHRASRSCAV